MALYLAAAAAAHAAAGADLRSICLNALGERSGEIVVLDVQSGAVLASVRSRVTEMAHPPGSVAKLLTAHAGLVCGCVSTGTRFGCANALKIGGRTYPCTLKGGHGRLDITEALAQSCNVWFYQAARQIGTARILKSWRGFGFAHLPDAPQVRSVERLAVGEEGLRVSALEMAGLARTIALKKQITDSPCRVLAAGMRGAVTHGTARELARLPFAVAGKTGSPGHTGDPAKRHGWFVGFAPYEKPRIAFAVFCLDGNSYLSAVPVAGKMLEEWRRQTRGGR